MQSCSFVLTKLHIITGTYLLQAQRSRFNQFDVKPTCLLCNTESENREHFLTSCESLAGHRAIYTEQLSNILANNLDKSQTDRIMNSCEELTQLIMDCTTDTITSVVPIPRKVTREIEQLTQRLIYALHLTRKSMLALIAPLHRRPPKKRSLINHTLYCSTQQSTTSQLTNDQYYGSHPVPQSSGGTSNRT